MKTLKLSHNSYWIDGDPVKISVLNGCQIIDVDIIDKDLHLSHSWRPFNSMYHGTLMSRYLKNFPTDCMLYVEFKTGDRQVQQALCDALCEAKFKSIVLVSFRFNPFFPLRYFNIVSFYERYKDLLRLKKFKNLKKDYKIKSVNLYKKSLWHF